MLMAARYRGRYAVESQGKRGYSTYLRGLSLRQDRQNSGIVDIRKLIIIGKFVAVVPILGL